MAEIRPFKGFRYHLDMPGKLGQYITPPYDMLDAAAIDALYDASPHNAVRIEQNIRLPGDAHNKDRHLRAASLLDEWIRDGHLKQDSTECVYVYRQKFSADLGTGPASYERTGIVCRVKLVDFSEGIVYPHENTLSGPKIDRYELLEACRTNTGQIFGLVADDDKELYRITRDMAAGEAQGFGVDSSGVRHELYKNDMPDKIKKLQAVLANRSIIIADGHHRYETALKYARDTGAPQDQFIMMTLVSMADPGLIIRPFHRMIKRNALSQKFGSVRDLARFFDISDLGPAVYGHIVEFMKSRGPYEMLFVDSGTKHSFGLTTGTAGADYLTSRPAGMSALWNSLSVSKINRLCVEGLMEQVLDGKILHDVIDYMNDASAAFEKTLAGGDYTGCFFIRPLEIEAIENIVSASERMPQKSTNFYPKLFSGLVFCRLDAS